MTEYRVVPADLERDEQAILGVWSRNLRSHQPEGHKSKYRWYYRNNPFGCGRCWLLTAGADSQIIGTAGLGIRPLLINGVRTRVGLVSDFAVDSEHRFAMPALLLQRTVLEAIDNDVSFIYGMPNEKSSPIVKRLGYRTITQFHRSVRVLRIGKFLRAGSGIKPFLAPFSPVIDLGLRAASIMPWTRRAGIWITEMTQFDERFDEFWNRVSPGYRMIGERTTEFLRWRFAACPLRTYRTFGLLSDGGRRLRGYIVFFIDDDQLIVADLMADESDHSRDDLVAGLLRQAYREPVSTVSICHSSTQWKPQLRRFGFRERLSEPTQTVVARTADSAESVVPFADWNLTLSDEDYQ